MRRVIARQNENACAKYLLGIGSMLGCLILVALISANPVHGADEKSWLRSCEKDSDCTSVMRDCPADWLPVNRKFKYIKAMENMFGPTCSYNVLSAQPTTSCVDHQCMNDPSRVRHWAALTENQKKNVIYAPVASCLAGKVTPMSFKKFDELCAPYIQKMDLSVREQQYSPESSLAQMMVSEIPCDELTSKAKLLQAQ